VGKTFERTAGRKAGERVARNPDRLLNYFSERNPLVRDDLDELQTILNVVSNNKADDVLMRAARVAAANDFKQVTPGLKGFLLEVP
jgi:hypothetical protein